MAVEVDEARFASEVLERSRSLPVVVDFWASWCGPCRTLRPVLEAAAAEREGSLVLAAVDVDANPGLAATYGVRGIPAVKAFRDGVPVAEFVGAQPRAAVERFLDGLVPSAADRLAASGDEASLRAAIEADPGHVPARLALARLLLASGEDEPAAAVLGPAEHDPVAAGMIARLRLRRDGASPAVRRALGDLDAGRPATALPDLVEAVREVGGEERDLLRRVVVGAFAELGEGDPLVAQLRPRLFAALY